MIESSEPIFAVSDIRATVRFYCDVLGFCGEWFWCDPGKKNEPPTFGGVRQGAFSVMFCLDPQMPSKIAGYMHFFRVDDVQRLYDRHKAAGATIVSDIENKPWGLREYTVRDPNGYHLRFAGPLKYERPENATDALPAHVRIELRKPSLDEYVELTKGVGWNVDLTTMPVALEHALFGVVAVDGRDLTCLGMLRVCGDGRHYTIWDVIVLPTHQGQKIGTAMMEAALAELRRRGPKGAFVGLFTGKGAFYERMGFGDGGGMCMIL